MKCDTHLTWRRFYRMPILWLFWRFLDNRAPSRCVYCKTPFFGTKWPEL